ncbi:outer membrane beta-barrel protein [bacterium]|nr:outer membrane beta-barrel protein [bacterium]
MGKREIHIFFLLTFLVSFSSVCGQNGLKRFSVGGFGGVGMPVGPSLFQDYYQWNFNAGVDFIYHFSQMTGLHFHMTYQPYHFDDHQVKEELEDAFGESGSVDEIRGGSIWMSLFSMHLMQYLQSPNRSPRFYVFIGGGLAIRKTADIEINGSIFNYQYNRTDTLRSETTFGLSGGAGFTITCTENISLFAQGQYHHIFSERIDFWNPGTFTVENNKRALSFTLFIMGLRLKI